MAQLAAERCEACTGATPRVEGAQLDSLRAQLSQDWRVEEGKRLRREYKFKTFAAAFGRATAIASIAEEEGHHPDVCVGWGYLDVTLTTHAISGLSRNDFIMAAKIDQLDR